MATEDIMQMAVLAKALGGSGNKSNIASLFGLDPSIVAQQQAQQALQASQQTALQYAQMDPMQRAQYAMFQGASGAAGGLLSTFGPESAQVQRAKQIEEYKKALSTSNININTSEGMLQGAELAKKMNLPEIAIELTNNAFSTAEIQAKTQKTLLPETETERNQAFLVGVENALAQGKPVAPEALQRVALIRQAMTAPKSYVQDGQLITVRGEDPLTNLPALSNAFKRFTPQQAPMQAPQGVQPTMPQQQTGSQQIAPGVTAMQVVPPKIDASVRKDIADTDKLIVSADKTYTEMNKLTSEVKGLDVSLARNVGRAAEAQLGLSSKDQITIDKMKRFIERNRNEILNQATGVQAKDDAERILNEVFGDPTIWRNPARLQEAWNSLIDMSKNNAEALRTKRQVLVPEGANVGAAPQAPKAGPKPKTSREDAFAKMKAANPNASDASINKWLDGRGY